MRRKDLPAQDVASDVALARACGAGDVDAWHGFVERYSGLILSIVRRYLVRETEDECRTLFVDVLQGLHDDKLGRYDGQATLATWVAVVTRSRCLDHIRRRCGRRHAPRWLRGCTRGEQHVWRLYYLEGRSCRAVRDELRAQGLDLTLTEVVATLSRLEDRLDRRTARRVAYDLAAREVGATSGRLLRYLDHIRAELAAASDRDSPDAELERREIEAGLDRLRESLAELPQVEGRVIRLHYFEGMTAREIAVRLELSGQRRAYTLIDRGLRKLGALFRRKTAARPLRAREASSDDRA